MDESASQLFVQVVSDHKNIQQNKKVTPRTTETREAGYLVNKSFFWLTACVVLGYVYLIRIDVILD